jgi:glycosyltransferase involved in cell wall biosynthesis
MRIVILQYGDYGDAYRRFQVGGPETYRDQRHSVEFVAALAPQHEVATVAVCDRLHDEELAPRLRSIGVSGDLAWDPSRFWPLLDRFDPELFICRTPNRVALAWVAKKRVPTLPAFADTFANRGLRDRLNNWRLARILRRCVKPCVANHSLSAARSLTRIGLSPDEIVPWEFERLKPMGEAKDAPPPDRAFRLFFAGLLIESKGVGDCIEAVAIANRGHAKVELTVAGPGDVDKWTAFARRQGAGASVRVLGIIAADQVLSEMRDHDAVIVPSRPDYAEGLPNTIFEALASRSPLIASDHPAFVERLRPEVDSLRFKAGHPQTLAEQVERLIREPGLYARLSHESDSALSRLYVGIEWSELMVRFIEDPLGRGDWVKGCSLAFLLDLNRSRTSGGRIGVSS